MVVRQGKLGVLGRLRYRCRNLSEGVAVGTAAFVSTIQRDREQKHVNPRSFMEQASGAGPPEPAALYATRVLRATD
jgi:hypothetical protein